MIVICEECGKKYRIDPTKMKGAEAKVRCKACSHVITISRPEIKPPEMPSPHAAPEPSFESGSRSLPDPEPEGRDLPPAAALPKRPGLQLKSLGLRTKMMILFLLLPSIFIVIAGGLYLWQLNGLSRLITNESTHMVRGMAENIIADTSKSVASQCKIYLKTHADLKKENFSQDADFRKVAVQKVGMTGYTALYEMPDAKGVWRTWAHVNPKIIAIDMSDLKKPLGNNFPGFWKVFAGVKSGVISKGYYSWQDQDGSVRDKYMVCTPMEGTRYVIAATTYLDEFTRPMIATESRAKQMTSKTRNAVFAILGGTLLLIFLTVSLYGHRLTGRIRSLTEVADRISVGELDAEIDTDSGDEIGALGEAVSRMQDSIRLSIERLRRRR
jgi:predicted Zn finger-like uncharacterized protein